MPLDPLLLDFFHNTSPTKLHNMLDAGTLQNAPAPVLVAALVLTELELDKVRRLNATVLAIIAERKLGSSTVEQLKNQLRTTG